MKNKKAELSTQQIVLLIILITSFAVILFFIARLNLSETTQEEICHNSVLTRGSSVLPGESVPLKCSRDYVCISNDNTCEKMTNPDLKKVSSEEEVYEVLAEEMTDCWWMFGEGKVNYVGKDFNEKWYCSICSQVAFDDSVNNIFEAGFIDKKEFYTYLADSEPSGKDYSYLSYLYGIEDIQTMKEILLEKEVGFGEINLDNQQYVMIGILSEVSTFKRVLVGAGVGAVVVAGAILTPFTGGVSLVSTAGVLFVSAGATAGGTILGLTGEGPTGNQFLKPTIVEVNSEEFKDLNCDSIETLA